MFHILRTINRDKLYFSPQRRRMKCQHCAVPLPDLRDQRNTLYQNIYNDSSDTRRRQTLTQLYHPGVVIPVNDSRNNLNNFKLLLFHITVFRKSKLCHYSKMGHKYYNTTL